MAKKSTEIIEIQPIQVNTTTIRIVGDTPLIMHTFSAKAKREILKKELGTTTTKAREPKNPIEDFVSAMYWLDPMPTEFTQEAVENAFENGARFGFPVTAFKQAAISAAYRMGWTKDKASMRGAFYIEADTEGYYAGDLSIDWGKKKINIVPNVFRDEPMIEIHADQPLMREDPVTLGMGKKDLRYRGEFKNWYADLRVNYNINGQYSMEQIINIINAGGYVCGVGEWRPERDGQYGMFHVAAT